MTIPRSVLPDFWYAIAYSTPYSMDLERCAIVNVPFLTPKRLAAQLATFSAVGYLAHPARAQAASSGQKGLTHALTWRRPPSRRRPCESDCWSTGISCLLVDRRTYVL